MSSVVTGLDRIAFDEVIEVECEADDLELLFLDWLNEIIYQMATRRMLFGKFDVQISDGHLRARLYGEPVDRERHEPAVEIKGATMTELAVDQNDGGEWVVQCVIDV